MISESHSQIMNPIKSKHIVIGIAVAFILFLFCRNGDEDYSYDQSGTHTLGTMQSQPSYRSMGREQYNPTSSTWSPNPSSAYRHETLQTKVKGYREETFWGEEHSLDEKVKRFSDDEFDDYLKEVDENDADSFWGATY